MINLFNQPLDTNCMAQKDTLYKLIKSLAPSEKSYVVKKLNANEKNKALVFLYTILNNQKELDEENIRKKYTRKYDLKTLPVHKNKLYEAILLWLVDLNQTNSIETIVAANFAKLDILISKSLYPEALREIENIEEIADKHQLPLIKITALDRYIKLMFDASTGTYDYDVIIEKLAQQKESLKEYTAYNKITSLRVSLNKARFKMSSDNERQKNYSFLNDALERAKPNDFHFLAPKLNYFHSIGNIHLFSGNYAEALAAYKEVVDCLDHSAELIERYSENYLSAYHNMCLCYVQLKNDKETINSINKIKDTDSKNTHLAYRIKERYIINIQFYYILKKEYAKLSAIVNEYENDLISNYFMYRATLYVSIALNCCITYLNMGDYKKSLKWSNHLINTKFSVAYDSLAFNRLFNLIIHYELNNLDHIESVLLSYEKYLVKISQYNFLQKETIRFFKSLVGENNPVEIKKLFGNYKQALSSIDSTEFTNYTEVTTTIIEWVDLKLS